MDRLGVVPGWSLSVLGQAPATGLTPLAAGQEPEIYAHISNWLDKDSNGDIRRQYNNADKTLSFGGWSDKLGAAPNPNPPYWGTYPKGEFEHVVNTLSNEIAGVTNTWNIIINTIGWLNSVQPNQDDDCQDAYDNAVPQALQTTSADYWVGQMMCALLWGLAAASLEGDLGIALSIAASLLGSDLSWTSQTPTTFSMDEYKTNMDAAVSAKLNKVKQDGTSIVANEVALALISNLVDNAWYWLWSTDKPPKPRIASEINRLAFYSNFIPAVYNVMNWDDTLQSVPYTLVWKDGIRVVQTIQAPTNSYVTTALANDQYNIALLYSGPSDLSSLLYPTPTLTDDLFDTIKVNQQQLLAGKGQWSRIPQYTYSGS